MTRQEMIKFIRSNPNVKITHTLFAPKEYIHSNRLGEVLDENGYIFENWYSIHNCGIRMRAGGEWEFGWSIWRNRNEY